MTYIWEIGPVIDGHNYSVGMRRTLKDNKRFRFPTCSNPVSPQGPSVHYVTSLVRGPISGTMSLDFAVRDRDRDAAFVATEGTASARLRLHFQRRGDDWRSEWFRWWSREYVELTPGRHRIAVPLEYANWTAVYGQTSEGPFNKALADPVRVGFTFGGSFAGHGVCLTGGDAVFVLRDFQIGLQ